MFPLDPAASAVRLEISEEFFTADMLDAYNVTNAGKNFQGD